MSSPETSAPTIAAPWRRWLVAVALLAVFAGALVLFTRHNGYPFFYHPDEYGKARQVVDGTRSFNFHHPLLMLNVASPLKKLAGKGPDTSKPAQLQRAVVAGRTASAIFAAVTVVALIVTGYLLGGPLAALGAGLVTLLQPMLFEHAHIFKEDAAVVMGLALTCLTAALFWENPSCPRRAVLLGMAVALAASGKYIGLTALVIALPVLLLAPGQKKLRRFGFFAGAFVVLFALANRQMFTHLGEWRESFNREVGMSVTGSRGVASQDPVQQYLYCFGVSVSATAVVFLLFNALHLFTTARRRSVAEWLIFFFPIAFTAMLMLSPRTSDRYFLPAAVLFNFNALVGVGLAAEWFTRAFGKFRVPGQIAFVALALFIGWSGQFAQFQQTWAQFKVDDRRDLEAWMNAHLPPGGLVAQDAMIGLPDPGHHKQKGMKREFSLEVVGLPDGGSPEFVPDLGTLEELRARGIRYVATSPKKSLRYTGGGMTPTEDGRADFERRKAFYSALPQQAALLWKSAPAEIDTLHPGLELYDLGARP